MSPSEKHDGVVRRAAVLDKPEQIAMFRLAAFRMYATSRAKGIHLTRPGAAPKLADVRRQYGVPARGWKQAAIELRDLEAMWQERGVPQEQINSIKGGS